jgi:hypothetical protein
VIWQGDSRDSTSVSGWLAKITQVAPYSAKQYPPDPKAA